MTAKPPDFEPLASNDPVPGDTGEIAALGKRYTDTAAEIARQAASLRKLAGGTSEGWKGKAGSVFAAHATDLAGRISQAQDRYGTTGNALTAAAAPMQEAQQRAYAAVWEAKDAQQQMTASAPGPPRPPGAKPPTEQEKAAEQARQNKYDSAQATLTAAHAKFAGAVSDYQSAASGAARKISTAVSHDGLKDSWWESHFGWVGTFFKVLAVAVIVLAVVGLIIACPFTAGLLALLPGITAAGLATTATVLGWTLFAATALQAVYDGVEAANGKESWTAFALDIVAMATFGFGKGVEVAAKGLTEFAEGAAKTVAAGRAGRAALRVKGLPGFLYSLRAVLGPMSDSQAFRDASAAAEHAAAVIQKVANAAEPSNRTVLLTMSSELGESLARLGALSDRVPGVARIAVPRTTVQALSTVDGFAQWASFLGGGVFTLHGIAAGG